MQVAVAEGLVWRLVEMVQRLDLNALSGASDEKRVAAATDTPVQISLVSLADLSAAVRCAQHQGHFPGHPKDLSCWIYICTSPR